MNNSNLSWWLLMFSLPKVLNRQQVHGSISVFWGVYVYTRRERRGLPHDVSWLRRWLAACPLASMPAWAMDAEEKSGQEDGENQNGESSDYTCKFIGSSTSVNITIQASVKEVMEFGRPAWSVLDWRNTLGCNIEQSLRDNLSAYCWLLHLTWVLTLVGGRLR